MRVVLVPMHTLSTMMRTLVIWFRVTWGFRVPGSLQMPDACAPAQKLTLVWSGLRQGAFQSSQRCRLG